MNRLIWIPTLSLFASNILDRTTTFVGLSAGYRETNPAQAWVLANIPFLFYISALLIPGVISLLLIASIRVLDRPDFQMQRRILLSFFFFLSVYSWIPVVSNLLILRGPN